jgi:hypothetical protein
MGVEPTADASEAPATGFEDRETHRDLTTPTGDDTRDAPVGQTRGLRLRLRLRSTRRRPIDTPPGECYDVRRRRSASPARVLSSHAFHYFTRAGAGQRKQLAAGRCHRGAPSGDEDSSVAEEADR